MLPLSVDAALALLRIGDFCAVAQRDSTGPWAGFVVRSLGPSTFRLSDGGEYLRSTGAAVGDTTPLPTRVRPFRAVVSGLDAPPGFTGGTYADLVALAAKSLILPPKSA